MVLNSTDSGKKGWLNGLNPLVPTKLKIDGIKIKRLQFARVYGAEHENHIQFRFGVNPFAPGGFEIRKMGY